MPLYRWDTIAAQDFPWLRKRAARSAKLFDGYRVDHLVGFYRTYGRPLDGGAPFFTPAHQEEQVALGERVLGILRGAGAEIIAEDLGVVPDFVRESLARLHVPGFRVHRWERQWNESGQPFRDPRDYPPVSVATTGTHDTEPLAVWWNNAADDEREAVLPGCRGRAFDAEIRDRLIEMLFASGSDLLLFPIQDVFGWPDRVNEPATVNDTNWTYRLPWPADRLDEQPEARECQARLRDWSVRYGRAGRQEVAP
jgi:4-alpha-glucanotransferase